MSKKVQAKRGKSKGTKGKTKKDQSAIPFTSAIFWNLVEGHDFKCALTGRELTETNTEVELKVPLKQNGKAVVSNLYCVDVHASRLARFLTEEQIIDLAIEIARHRGRERGYALRPVSKKKV